VSRAPQDEGGTSPAPPQLVEACEFGIETRGNLDFGDRGDDASVQHARDCTATFSGRVQTRKSETEAGAWTSALH
jgi:hypothetical protein